VIRWDATGPYEVVFTTRTGGVSEGPYASLNLGRKTGDDVERVDENRRRACAEIGADAARLALNFQVHSKLVHRAREGERGGVQGDGLWTDEPGLPIACRSRSPARTEQRRRSASCMRGGSGCSPASSRRA
jgi:copper oxidase (laccase) domain-containing protein